MNFFSGQATLDVAKVPIHMPLSKFGTISQEKKLRLNKLLQRHISRNVKCIICEHNRYGYDYTETTLVQHLFKKIISINKCQAQKNIVETVLYFKYIFSTSIDVANMS